jgi:diguanylate cyclase (GGDEF)-like protein
VQAGPGNRTSSEGITTAAGSAGGTFARLPHVKPSAPPDGTGPDHASVRRYVAAVGAAGIVVAAAVLAVDGLAGLHHAAAAPFLFVLFTLCAVLAQLLPLRVPGHVGELTTASTFVYAVLLTFGTAPAVITAIAATLVADLARGRSLRRIGFGAGQATIAWAATGAMLSTASGVPTAGPGPHFASADVPTILACGAVFFAISYALSGAIPAIAQRVPVLAFLRRDLAFQATTAAMLVGLAPIVAVAAAFDLILIPLMALPLGAIYRAGRQAVINEHQALHDALTDLPNRALFHDRAATAIAAARRDGSTVAVLLMDLDRFKEINDTLGHHHGDLLLREIGPRLHEALRESDSVARLGGDEFACLLVNVASPESAAEVARRVLASLERPVVVEGTTLDVGASIGIACFPDHGDDVDTVIQRADIAMYVAKEAQSGFEIYAPEQNRHSPYRLSLVGELRRAIEAGELDVHYQPKAELRSGHVRGVEALVRWHHPRHGMVLPGDFVPLAEHTGLIKPLTVHVMHVALGQCQRWRREGLDMSVSVNISARTLLDRQLPQDVAHALSFWGLGPECLVLEITESTIMADPGRAKAILEQLSEMGVRLAIDDFGTGYSSLAYLKRLPVSEIKIDKSFVMNMTTDRSDAMIVQSTINLARNLGLETVAEGVENAEAWRQLVELGCDRAQGYFLSRPLSAGDLDDWLASKPRAADAATRAA